MGPQTLDDAGVYRIAENLALIQTVDYFTPIVDNPFLFGQIAAANALSDIYAMGGTPITVLNIVGYPIARLGPEILAQILAGGAEKVREAGAVIMGGHSIDDQEPKFGMAVTGVCHPDEIWTNSGAEVGDVLILTKPIGAGIVTTGIKRGLTQDEDIATVVAVMAQLNKTAAEVARSFTVHACTDVTGYGLLGHAWEMADASGKALEFVCSEVPVLAAAWSLTEQGSVPSGSKRNRQHVESHVHFARGITEPEKTILSDSMTSGGLLLSVPEAEGRRLVAQLHSSGAADSRIIGRVLEGPPQISVQAEGETA